MANFILFVESQGSDCNTYRRAQAFINNTQKAKGGSKGPNPHTIGGVLTP
jgi:hypothetical protein